MPSGEFAVWIQQHDNGWTTQVSEQIDRTYLAAAAPSGSAEFPAHYVEMDEPTAKAAALFALAQLTGHRTCSEACGGWQMHTHRIELG